MIRTDLQVYANKELLGLFGSKERNSYLCVIIIEKEMARSKEEAIAAGVKTAETKHNMKRRKSWHDYHRKGTYMLTMAVEGRQPLLGRLISSTAPTVPTLAPTVPTPATTPAASSAGKIAAHVELTPLGRAIRDEEARKISTVFKMVEVWKLCIMPDHIHMIVHVREDMPEGKHLGQVIAGFKGGCSRAWWKLLPCADAHGVVTSASTPASIPASTPAASAAGKIAAGTTAGTKAPSLFEPGYNDLILLDGGQLEAWKHYLDDNPRRLALKRLHPDLFVTTHYCDIGEWHCQAVGNRFLLDIPQKAAVIVHSAYTDADYARYREQWLACGEAGGVLVSAAIAPREKEVMHEAMERGYSVIWVRENGFPPLYKPSGRSFDACTKGCLLQVSPWEYHTEQRTISREQCLMLNRLVEEIVSR